jgi:hypothetical protein
MLTRNFETQLYNSNVVRIFATPIGPPISLGLAPPAITSGVLAARAVRTPSGFAESLGGRERVV